MKYKVSQDTLVTNLGQVEFPAMQQRCKISQHINGVVDPFGFFTLVTWVFYFSQKNSISFLWLMPSVVTPTLLDVQMPITIFQMNPVPQCWSSQHNFRAENGYLQGCILVALLKVACYTERTLMKRFPSHPSWKQARYNDQYITALQKH